MELYEWCHPTQVDCGGRPPDLQEGLRHVVVTTEMPRFVLRGEAETVPWKETQLFIASRIFSPHGCVTIGSAAGEFIPNHGTPLMPS
jgi:hypothetical protein